MTNHHDNHVAKENHDHGGQHGHPAKDPDSHTGLTWIFHFVDIIYVGAVYSIGQLFEQCGTNHKVFFMASSYMSIMFTTRYQFDQYASTFSTHKVDDESQEFLRICLMILYCMAIYSMTLNIAFKTTEEEHDGAGYFGHCVRNVTYDNAFAASFLISRAAIVTMYYVKYKSNQYAGNADFWKLFLRKLIPMVIGCGLMTMIFADVSPVIAYFTVAFVEVVSEFIGEAVVKFRDEVPPLMPDAHHLQERLGLFFMLILGETMVGTLFVFYDQKKIKRTYGSCIAAFILVTSIGMQFFERAQADVNSDSNYYGDTYDEKNDYKRLISFVPGDTRQSLAVRPSEAASSMTADASGASKMQSLQMQARPSEMGHVVGGNDHQGGAAAVVGPVPGEFNHHPLKHKQKRYYALYVVLHALTSFFMLIATTGIIEIYYELEGYNPHACQDHGGSDDAAHAASEGYYSNYYAHNDYGADEESHSHYFHLKAQVAGGLASVWFCMMLMEMLQPAYFNSLCANFFTSNLVDQRYSKFMIFIKFCVIIAHLAMMAFPGSSGEGNYFIGYNAVIAAIPSLCDIFKIIYEWKFKVKEQRIEAELNYRASSMTRITASAPPAPAHPHGHASPNSVNVTLSPMSTAVN